MIEQYASAALTHSIPEEGLETGDVGVVVSVYDIGAYDVEFANEYGETIAILTLREPDIICVDVRDPEYRPFQGDHIPHVTLTTA